jgi:ADP-heptose:LPS heptosyltransferase
LVVGEHDCGLEGMGHSERVISCIRLSLPLPLLFCLVAECDLFIGVDSCFLHVADLFGVPGVGLFGPTSPQCWGFRFAEARHVTGGGSLDDISVEAAFMALEELMLSRF